jgi:hypothetical protein
MELDEKASALWAIAACVALLPAVIIVCGGLATILTENASSGFGRLAVNGGMVVGGCLGLAAVVFGVAFPQRLQHPKLKCAFFLFSCAGIAAMWGFISVYWHWLDWKWWLIWWLVLGPLIVGFTGIYRILRFR